MNSIQKLITDICESKGIKYTFVSKDWVMIMEKNNITRYLIGYKFDLNNHAVGQICDDKYALFDVLRNFNIPITEYYLLYKNYDREEVLKYAKKYNLNMVVKSNTGTCGNDMYHTMNEEDLFFYIDKLLNKHFSISISPFYEIKHEYRSIILNNNIELFYGKEKPIVVGDGKRTIYELLLEFNDYYFKNIEVTEELNRVLDKDEVFEYNWQFNLSKGSRPFFANDTKLINDIEKLALTVAKKLNLNFVSVDIIELVTGELLVLEANSGVMMENFIQLVENGKEIATNIYSKVIDEMFE